MSYPPPVPRITFQGHSVEGNIKVDDVAKVQSGEARFGRELDWEKLWRHQVVGVKMSEINGNKLFFFLGIQRQRLAAKVRPGEARFEPELDWEKPWRQ